MVPSPLVADIVAKVFLGWRTNILRAADALCARRREGPYRFIQNRSRTSVATQKSHGASEKSKVQLWRDFQGSSIFDFCNKICQKRTHAAQQTAAHSITPSALASSVDGKLTPSAFAVFKLITSSNLVGCS